MSVVIHENQVNATKILNFYKISIVTLFGIFPIDSRIYTFQKNLHATSILNIFSSAYA